jgi:hypothetical protein
MRIKLIQSGGFLNIKKEYEINLCEISENEAKEIKNLINQIKTSEIKVNKQSFDLYYYELTFDTEMLSFYEDHDNLAIKNLLKIIKHTK